MTMPHAGSEDLVESTTDLSRTPLLVRRGTSDEDVFQAVFTHRQYGIPVSFEPKVIVDAGANAGYVSVYFANRFPGALVVAIEPERSNARLCRRNTEPYPNVTLIEGALWPRWARLEIFNPDDLHWAFRVRETDPRRGVRSVTIPQILECLDPPTIDILKLDIEGAERALFERGADWLGSVRVLVMELHDRFEPGCSEALEKALAPYRYTRSEFAGNALIEIAG